MFKEKIDNLKKQSNREEVKLIIKDNEMLDVLKKLVELKMNKISFIDHYGDEGFKKWAIELKINELEYETLIEELKGFEIYSCEEDRFGKYFEKRLGA